MSSQSRHRILVLSILLLALALRIYDLGGPSFWQDEALCFVQSEHLADVICGRNMEVHPPLFYVLVHFMRWFGESEYVLRLLPLMFGMLLLWGIYCLARRFGEVAALIALGLSAINPFLIFYSRELKMYSLLPLLVLLELSALHRAVSRPGAGPWLQLILWSTLVLYTHNIGFYLIIIQNLFLFLTWPRHRRTGAWIGSQLVVAVLYLPWLSTLIKQLRHVGQAYWIPGITWQEPVRTLFHFNLGYGSDAWGFRSSLLVMTLPMLYGIFVLSRRRENRLWTLNLLLFMVGPPLITIALSPVRSLYLDRVLAASQIPYLLFLAIGLAALESYLRFPIIALVLLLTSLALPNLYLQIMPTMQNSLLLFPKKPFRSAATFVRENLQAGDLVLHSNVNSYFPFRCYLPADIQFPLTRYPEMQVSVLESLHALPVLPMTLEPYARRFWLVQSWWGEGPLDARSSSIRAWFNDRYMREDARRFGAIRVFCYRIAPGIPDCDQVHRVLDSDLRTEHQSAGDPVQGFIQPGETGLRWLDPADGEDEAFMVFNRGSGPLAVDLEQFAASRIYEAEWLLPEDEVVSPQDETEALFSRRYFDRWVLPGGWTPIQDNQAWRRRTMSWQADAGGRNARLLHAGISLPAPGRWELWLRARGRGGLTVEWPANQRHVITLEQADKYRLYRVSAVEWQGARAYLRIHPPGEGSEWFLDAVVLTPEGADPVIVTSAAVTIPADESIVVHLSDPILSAARQAAEVGVRMIRRDGDGSYVITR